MNQTRSIELKNIRYSIQDGNSDRILFNDISHNFAPGKITLISGPSGSGKTTLLYAIAGLLQKLDRGTIVLNGQSLYDLSVRERDRYRLNAMSIIFQNLNLFSFMNVEENICVPLLAKNKPVTKETKSQIARYLDTLGLGQIQEKRLRQLSGGEQQRIAIIRAIIDKPPVVLCDEPIANLDQKSARLFLEQLQELITESGLTAVIVSHDVSVKAYSHHVVELLDGKLEVIS